MRSRYKDITETPPQQVYNRCGGVFPYWQPGIFSAGTDRKGVKIMKRQFKNITAISLKKNSLLFCTCVVCIILISGALTGCSAMKDDQANDNNADTAKEAESIEETAPDFALTDSGKSFLEKMCRQLPDFSDEMDMDEEFWKSFIFFGYTSSVGETVRVYREDMGFDETERKVSEEEVSQYAQLAFGRELPDIKPVLADMAEGQTALYYEDGYYYIGVSDFPDLQYVYENCEIYEDDDYTYALVTYTVNFEDTENVGTVTLRIRPADNENKFVITSKVTDM